MYGIHLNLQMSVFLIF